MVTNNNNTSLNNNSNSTASPNNTITVTNNNGIKKKRLNVNIINVKSSNESSDEVEPENIQFAPNVKEEWQSITESIELPAEYVDQTCKEFQLNHWNMKINVVSFICSNFRIQWTIGAN